MVGEIFHKLASDGGLQPRDVPLEKEATSPSRLPRRLALLVRA